MRMSPEVRRTIAAKMREARIVRRQTQTEVAKSLGVSRQMVSRYENGHDSPGTETLGKVLRYFGLEIEFPGYTLTAKALEARPPAEPSKAIQFELPYGQPQEFLDVKVRVTRAADFLEVLISRLPEPVTKA